MLLLRCNDLKHAMAGLFDLGNLPTMKSQLSQLP